MKRKIPKRISVIFLSMALCLTMLPAEVLATAGGAPEASVPQELSAVETVQAMIAALPTVEKLKAMTQEEQSTVYADLQAAYDAYEALSDEEKQEVTGAEIFDTLFAVFNGMVDALDDSGFIVDGGESGKDYTLSGNTLTIKTSEPLTISGGTADSPITGQIVIQSSINANLTLNGVNIKGTANDGNVTNQTSAITLSSGSSLTLTLAQGSNNILSGGSGGSYSPGAPAINVPVGTTLTVLCANRSNNDHICSENCGSLSATGGSSSGSRGGVGIGGGIQDNGPAGTTSESCGTVLLLGGNIKVKGGTGSGGNKAKDIGGADNTTGTGGAGGTVIILTNVTSSDNTLTVGGGTSGTGSATADNGAGIKPSTGTNTYEVYGSLELPADLTIPAGVTVNIPQNTTLTVPSGKELTNNGTITGDGTLTLNGNANGNGTVSVTNFTPKTQASTPPAPSDASTVTATSVTLTAVTDSGGVGGIQYGYTKSGESSVPDDRWQTGTTFDNLSPNTTYTFYARYAGNGFYNPSAASSNGLTVKTSTLVDAETPSITTHPQGGTYTVGADTTLSVAASVNDGGTLSYQWYSNTIDSNTGGTAISGATTSSYTPPTSAAGTTYYYCVVTNTNNSVTGEKTATAASNAAAIKVVKDVTISTPSYMTITASAGAGGTISPTGSVSVLQGLDKTFTITPDEGYEISDVLIDGRSIGAASSYTFENVRANHTIEAVFAKSEETLEAEKNARLKAGVENTTIKLKSTLGKGFIRLNWEKSPGYKVDYYEVFKSTKRYSDYGTESYFDTKQGGLTGWYKNTKELKKGTRYYYKVRGVREIAGETVYTQWSNKAWRLVK